MLIPWSVRRAYGLSADESELEIEHVPSNINLTYFVRGRGARAPELVLQRLHSVFGAQVHVDIAAVTEHLVARGLETPRLVPNAEGALWTSDDSSPTPHVWRALTYVDGVAVHHTEDARWLESAASLLGAFHRALADLPHEFVHQRPLHDTRRHLANLSAALASGAAAHDAEAQQLGASVLRHAEHVRLDFASLPRRIIHGDPKLSNVLFDRQSPGRARCMIDLDTVGRGYLAYELGDALRSWCNPAGENLASPRFELASFSATLCGYARSRASDVTLPELLSAVDGLETVSTELSSRFAADAIQDCYFGWDSTRFGSRREHNLVRAQGQLALARVVRAERTALVAEVERAVEGGRALRQPVEE